MIPIYFWSVNLVLNALLFTFQVMVLGDSGVGKTCLLVRFRDDMFLGGNYISTVGVDFRVRRTIVFGLIKSSSRMQMDNNMA